jgi:hypothetical protein
MNKNELIFAPGTSEQMKRVATTIPPYDLLKAYREARQHFGSPDIALVVVEGQELDGFQAFTRAAYIEEAFKRWGQKDRELFAKHPISVTAQKRCNVPADANAFWLIIESPKDEGIGYVAISIFLHREESALS